ncbi:acyltransferase [Pseudarthrobacter oxydans]|uniref:acyltransferase family protein n=1 Tax=Pseudarthrobacter oxydans TaxID=1671 RepID=UPI002AA633A0|nr:acyltransferase [Pseudarthrobacter oxydans]WPU08579.1 acyltransferase [Pseudarthrobacter oxydans]
MTIETTRSSRRRNATSRFDALDGIRSLAVFAVFTYHAVPSLMRGGGAGVDIFFTLSGFVITLLLLNERLKHGSVRLGAFYLRRMARLWPALLLVCLAVASLSLLLPSSSWRDEQGNALLSSLHIMNFARGGWFAPSISGGAMGHTWSLAVEEHFYLVWPLLLIVGFRFLALRGLLVVTLCLSAAAVAVRLVLQLQGAGWERVYNGPDTRADQLLIGCALAVVFKMSEVNPELARRLKVTGRVAGVAAALALVGLCVAVTYPRGEGAWDVAYRSFAPAVIALATAVVIAAVVSQPKHTLTRLLDAPALSRPGRRLSYGVYLWHYPVLFALTPVITGESSGLIRFAAALVITVALAWLSARFIEEPIRRIALAATRRSPARSTPPRIPQAGLR